MNSKKSLITIIVIIVVVVAGWYFWRGGFSSWGIGGTSVTSPSTGGTTTSQTGMGGQVGEPTAGGQTGSIGAMTDDIYIDILSRTAYYAKDPSTYASHMKDLFAKYGITQENVQAYGDTLQTDPARAQSVAQKYLQKLQELQKASQ